MRKLLIILAALLLGAGAAHAQRNYPQAELDALLAPVALQPDPVLSQILMAATYPEDVAAAARWSRANPRLKGEDAVRAVAGQPWDPSVKSLVSFPELLQRMDESPQWLRDLGEAFLLQEAQVMDTVQGLRRRAQATGQLATTEQTAVYAQGEAIVVQPRTQVVYVSYYDPYVVYGPWWWPYYRPVIWRPWAPRAVFVTYGVFYSTPDWHHRHVRVVHRPTYVHAHQTPVVPGKWQHARHARKPAYQPHIRVPEAQRRPIVQSMPAANGFSQHERKAAPRPERRDEQRIQPRREQRGTPGREQRDEPRHEQRGRDQHRGQRG